MWVTDIWGWIHFMDDYNRVLQDANNRYGKPGDIQGTVAQASRHRYIKQQMTELIRANPKHLRFLDWILPDHWPEVGAGPKFGSE